MIKNKPEIRTNEEKLLSFVLIVYWIANFIIDIIMFPEYRIHCIFCFISSVLSYVVAFSFSMIVKRIIIKHKTWTRPVANILLFLLNASLICGILWIIYNNFLVHAFLGSINTNTYFFLKYFWYNLFSSVYPFLGWISLFLGFKIYEDILIQKRKTEAALSLAQNAELEMLKYQLNPGFIFNTFSSLRSLVRKKENSLAENIVTQVSEFLKYSLLEGESNMVPLSREIKIIKHFIDIERLRLNGLISVEYDIDSDAENFPIPVFLIHPLVENAIKFGTKTSPLPINISISAKMRNGLLTIKITNKGNRADADSDEDISGMELKNTRIRLNAAYPDNHSLEMFKDENSVSVIIEIMKRGKTADV